MAKSSTKLASSRVVDKSRDAEPFLTEHLPYLSSIDDRTILLKDGDLMASFVVDGIDATTNNEVTVSELADCVSRLIAQEASDIAFYIHKISARVKPSLPLIDGESFAAHVDSNWQNYIQNCGLRQRTLMITLVIRPNKLTGLKSYFSSNREASQRKKISDKTNRLNRVILSFSETLQNLKPRRLSLSSGEWLGHLRSLVSGVYAPLKPGVKFTPLNDLIATTNINFTADLVTIFGASNETMRYAAVMSLKDYPPDTYAGMWDALNTNVDMVVTHSFTRIDNVTALETIQRMQRQRQAAEDAGVSLSEQLSVASDDLASSRVVFGKHHATVTVFAQSEEELDESVSLVNRVVTESGASIGRASLSAQAEFFAQHPGNYSYRTRAAMISSQNFSEFAALHSTSLGRPKELSPWGDAVAVVPTAYGEPYRLNLHLAGSEGERTVGHSIVLGQTGSGKTLGTAFLLTQALRLNPRIIIFDKDRGFEMAVRALVGDYTAVRLGEKTGFNPFQAEKDERGVSWLTDWLTNLAESNSSELTPLQREAIAEAVIGNVSAEPSLQNFQMFRTQFQSTDDDSDLYTRFGRWCENGEFGWLFSGEDEDNLTIQNQVCGFDLTEVFDNAVIRTTWLSYIFRRIERMVEDEHPTLIVLDEAWKLLDDPYFQTRLKDWMLTMRKKNVAVILLTQRVSHLTDSAAGGAILESAVTRLVYPSSFNTHEELKPLKLTSNETEFLLTSNVGNRLALFQSGEDSVLLDMNLAALGGAVSVLGGGPGEKAPADWRERTSFWKELI